MVTRQLGAATPFPGKFFHRLTGTGEQCSPLQEFFDSLHTQGKYKAIPHNSKCRYGERGAAAAKPKAQIILDVLSSILATQMPCRSRRSGARAVRRELCGIALTFCGYISCTAGCSPRPRRVRAGKQAVRRGLPLVPGIFKNFIPLAANSQGLGRGIKIHSFAS